MIQDQVIDISDRLIADKTESSITLTITKDWCSSFKNTENIADKTMMDIFSQLGDNSECNGCKDKGKISYYNFNIDIEFKAVNIGKHVQRANISFSTGYKQDRYSKLTTLEFSGDEADEPTFRIEEFDSADISNGSIKYLGNGEFILSFTFKNDKTYVGVGACMKVNKHIEMRLKCTEETAELEKYMESKEEYGNRTWQLEIMEEQR